MGEERVGRCSSCIEVEAKRFIYLPFLESLQFRRPITSFPAELLPSSPFAPACLALARPPRWPPPRRSASPSRRSSRSRTRRGGHGGAARARRRGSSASSRCSSWPRLSRTRATSTSRGSACPCSGRGRTRWEVVPREVRASRCRDVGGRRNLRMCSCVPRHILHMGGHDYMDIL
jgi:hypothetical protein